MVISKHIHSDEIMCLFNCSSEKCLFGVVASEKTREVMRTDGSRTDMEKLLRLIKSYTELPSLMANNHKVRHKMMACKPVNVAATIQ
jgi:C4-dicarboxylate-specific signal transduction histidine kinase